MTGPTATAVVEQFWRLMSSNDFDAVGAVLASAFILDWPQSNERIVGAARFIQMNQEYPAHGRWRFTLNRLVASATEVVTEVAITDGVQSAKAISFFSVEDGKITRMVEYWPEPYPAPSNRAHLVEKINY
jgi:ketosteroid isomerase-like protein